MQPKAVCLCITPVSHPALLASLTDLTNLVHVDIDDDERSMGHHLKNEP